MEKNLEIIEQREIELLEKTRKINLQKLFTENGMSEIILAIKNEVKDFNADVSTKEGRAEIISLAFKIAKCKAPIKNLASELKEESKKLIDSVNSQWNRYEAEIDALRDEIRKPVDEIEEKEAAELKAKKIQLHYLESLKSYISDGGSESYKNALKKADELMNFDWQDFQFKADAIFDQVKELLKNRHDAALKNEADQAELAHLKKEKEEREKKEREEQIARQAVERAKIEADLREKRIEQEKIDAENRAKEAERLRIEQAEIAEKNRILAEKKAKEDAEKAIADAIELERNRVEAEKRKEAEALEKRETNKRHVAKIKNDAVEKIAEIIIRKIAIEDLEVSDQDFAKIAKEIVEAIARNEVPHIQINY